MQTFVQARLNTAMSIRASVNTSHASLHTILTILSISQVLQTGVVERCKWHTRSVCGHGRLSPKTQGRLEFPFLSLPADTRMLIYEFALVLPQSGILMDNQNMLYERCSWSQHRPTLQVFSRGQQARNLDGEPRQVGTDCTQLL